MSWLRTLWAWLRPEPPAPWTGSCLRDRNRDRAFPKRRSWEKQK